MTLYFLAGDNLANVVDGKFGSSTSKIISHTFAAVAGFEIATCRMYLPVQEADPADPKNIKSLRDLDPYTSGTIFDGSTLASK